MYIDHVLEVYKVDLPILKALLSSLVLINTRFLFCPNFLSLTLISKAQNLYKEDNLCLKRIDIAK